MREGKAIMLIEDDVAVRDVVAEMLVMLGYSVTACESADEGMTQLNAGSACDVLITDVVMPGTNGLEVAALVRRWRPRTPVILMTGDVGAIDSSIGDGFVPLLKPFTADQLQRVVAEALRTRST